MWRCPILMPTKKLDRNLYYGSPLLGHLLIPQNQALPFSVYHQAQVKWDVTLIPANHPGVATGIGTRVAFISYSTNEIQTSAQTMHDGLGHVADTVLNPQDQLEPLVEVVLQNHRGLDLTAEKEGEQCCFYTKESSTERWDGRDSRGLIPTGLGSFLSSHFCNKNT